MNTAASAALNAYAPTSKPRLGQSPGLAAAMVWSGYFNVLVVLAFSGAVAFGFIVCDPGTWWSGRQIATVRDLVLASVLTLPAAILLSGSLYGLFVHLF